MDRAVDAATGTMGCLLPKLRELLKEVYNKEPLPKGVEQDMAVLESEVSRTYPVVGKATELALELPVLDYMPEFTIWASNVRGMFYMIDNEVDTILAQIRMEGNGRRKCKARYQMARTIKDIKQRVLAHPEIPEGYNFQGPLGLSNVHWRRRDGNIDVGDIIGMEEARDDLIKIICEEDQQLKILSVVGQGGLGKTTLAKAVYDGLQPQFDYSAFVTVSQKPHMMQDLHQSLLYGGYLDDEIHLNQDEKRRLAQEIKELLQNKRYLIVIDDLWDEESWDLFSLNLPRNNRGSRVIITTSVNSIAEKCCSDHKDWVYEIMPLGYENSKRLFLKSCFDFGYSCHDTLTEVDEILKICGGMPRAIICIALAIASLATENVEKPWQEMMKSSHSAPGNFHTVEELMMNSVHYASGSFYIVENLIQVMSYSCSVLPCSVLPKNLRTCLLYLAASAKNKRVQRDNLVRKWIAEGFIPGDDDCSREEVADRYFDELINRNVIQPVKYGNYLGKETYEITYMTLYALRKISQEYNFATFLCKLEPHVNEMPVRLFIHCTDSEQLIGKEGKNLINARSVTMIGPTKSVSFNFKNAKYVRVLDLYGCEDLDNSAMDDICQMILLKYLSLKRTQVTEIPPQISNLQYLETLDVRQTQVKELPKEVLQLPKLACLYFGQSGSLGGVKLPSGSGQLKSVKVMGSVDSRECSGSAMKEISELTEVRELEVVLYDRPDDKERNDKLLSCVGKCSNLQSLIIHGDSNPSDKLPAASPNFPLLEKLIVAGRFIKIPGWIAQLGALKKLEIKVCKLTENDLGIIKGLPCLNILALAMVCIPREQVAITSAGFGSLEVFCFDCRVPWISFQEKAMPNLKHLQLKLYAGPAGKFPAGIMFLESLKMVTLLYTSQSAGSVGVTETVALVKKEADNHANLIKLFINGDREIFPPSRSAHKGVTGTEIDMSVNRVTAESEIEEVAASE